MPLICSECKLPMTPSVVSYAEITDVRGLIITLKVKVSYWCDKCGKSRDREMEISIDFGSRSDL